MKNWKKWAKGTAIRTVKTMAQTATGVIGTTMVISGVDWRTVVSASVLSGVVCVLMNVSNIEDEE